MISKITAAETKRRRSFGEGKKLMESPCRDLAIAQKGATIWMILPSAMINARLRFRETLGGPVLGGI
jgi:hypothetical protein